MHTNSLHGRLAVAMVCLSLGSLVAAPAVAGDFRTILVDADSTDWIGVPAAHVDPAGDHGGASVDLGAIHLANDDDYVYLRFQIHGFRVLQGLPSPLRVFIDGDQSSATGFLVQGLGSDLMIEFTPASRGYGIDLYEQTAGNFRAFNVGHAALEYYHGPTAASTSFELRLKRAANLPLHGTTVFPTTGFRLALEALNGGAVTESAPNVPGTLSYTMATGTPPPPPANDLAKHKPQHLRILSYNTENDGLFHSSRSARFTRILQALQPDVIAFQELWNSTAAQVIARLNADLPLPGGGTWWAFKGNRGQITASRYQLVAQSAAPWGELATHVLLPVAQYPKNLYVINSHLKCCGNLGSSEDAQRQAAADAIAAWIRDLRTPGGSADLAANTPIVHLGDFNLVGSPQPLWTVLTGDIVDQGTHGADFPPDWDDTPMTASLPVHGHARSAYTWRDDGNAFSPGKLDFLLYTDSVVEVGNRFILNTLAMSGAQLSAAGLQQDDTRLASDHLPLVTDLMPVTPVVAVGPGPGGAALALRATPNPLSTETSLRFVLARAATVSLCVYDVRGGLVREWTSGRLEAGEHARVWDGRDASGRPTPAGVYLARLSVREDGDRDVAGATHAATATHEVTTRLVRLP